VAVTPPPGPAPSGLTFTALPGGLTAAVIAADHATARVALQGGQVLAFQPRGQRPVLFVSRHSHYAEGRAIRGGIPVCWPWFGPHPADPTRPAHGFARTALWSVRASEMIPAGTTRLRLGLTDSDATRRLWPHRFELELTVTVGPVLDVALRIRNPGPAAFTCTGALHSYLRVSDIGRVTVGGLEGGAYLDTVAGHARAEQAGPVTIAGETDRIYLDTTADCLVADAGWGRVIRLAKRGSRTTVVWNPWTARARQLPDLGDEEYRQMLCVETANAAGDQVTVPAGGEHELATTLGIEPG
jgi:glucose-6-phosphate 1-epimerase